MWSYISRYHLKVILWQIYESVCNRCIKDMHDEGYANYIHRTIHFYEFMLRNVPYQRFLNATRGHFSKHEILPFTQEIIQNWIKCGFMLELHNKCKISNNWIRARTWNIKPSLEISVSNINEQALDKNSITVFVFRIKVFTR